MHAGSIGYGAMGFSWGYGNRAGTDPDAVIGRALELGCTLIDTADVYGPHENERLVGRAIARRREEVVLATKCGLVVDDPATFSVRVDGRPEHILAACDDSLRRLGVEAIDLYYLHRADPAVAIEESVGALAQLVAAGKVRAIGLSEVDVPLLERASAVHRIAAVQSELSLWTRDALPEVLPWCVAHDVAFIPFSPLGRGFLTGRVTSPQDLPQDDYRHRWPRFQAEAMAANAAIVARTAAVAARHGVTPGQVALAWVLAQGEQVIPIPGTKRIPFLEENAAAADIALTADDVRELDALPPSVGDRY
jgi:aryl-alcohol dehydrogenase-like predicted oxidoreductase